MKLRSHRRFERRRSRRQRRRRSWWRQRRSRWRTARGRTWRTRRWCSWWKWRWCPWWRWRKRWDVGCGRMRRARKRRRRTRRRPRRRRRRLSGFRRWRFYHMLGFWNRVVMILTDRNLGYGFWRRRSLVSMVMRQRRRLLCASNRLGWRPQLFLLSWFTTELFQVITRTVCAIMMRRVMWSG